MATKHHEPHWHLASTFGDDRFGLLAERFSRFFGTPQFIISQSVIVLVWIVFNTIAFTGAWHFDEMPFIFLNLAFSTQAAYAAPLILLAQTRQAERDKHWTDADARHREELSRVQGEMLRQNTTITESVHKLTQDVHAWMEMQRAEVEMPADIAACYEAAIGGDPRGIEWLRQGWQDARLRAELAEAPRKRKR